MMENKESLRPVDCKCAAIITERRDATDGAAL
jgi:hypothetical protein